MLVGRTGQNGATAGHTSIIRKTDLTDPYMRLHWATPSWKELETKPLMDERRVDGNQGLTQLQACAKCPTNNGEEQCLRSNRLFIP